MKTITKTKEPAFELAPFHLKTDEFIQIVEELSDPNSELEFTTGDYFDDTRFVLETIEELKKHADKIVSPCELRINTVVLKLGKHVWSLRFDEADRALAESLLNRLSQYKPWHRFVGSDWFAAIGAVLVVLPAAIYLDWGTVTTLYLLASAGFVLVFCSVYYKINFLKPTVVHSRRPSFWFRNRDKILVAMIVFLATLAITKAFEVLTNRPSEDASANQISERLKQSEN
ncbi:hypothetical protein [Ruegeria sp. HKCCD6157]|uniref:hypothetical protein n=1 Tax=Ruegeria sp. HKCCD6157 TaxID=2690707 RepID=UPI001490F5E2|nr:hypothetical protein [Ruegeria sp. HKCCD6157]NOE26464.1 hypothetical protein [Ruegeria sp. HKCCD6157]